MTSSFLSNLSAVTKQFIGIRNTVNVFAVHSQQNNLSPKFIELWYEEAIKWIKSFGASPQSFSAFGISGFQEAKGYSFTCADKKLRKRGFRDIEAIYIYSSPPVKEIFQFDHHIECSIINSSINYGFSSMVWVWEEPYDSLDPFISPVYLDFLKKSKFIDYAFFTQSNSKVDPITWASLSAVDIIEKAGSIQVNGKLTKQIKEEGRHVIDFLKEIYPYQILSPIHLSYCIGDLTLEDWIKSSDSHGTLSKFSQDRWLWEISEEQLPAVRQALIENNLLTLYLPDMSRILEDYGKPNK